MEAAGPCGGPRRAPEADRGEGAGGRHRVSAVCPKTYPSFPGATHPRDGENLFPAERPDGASSLLPVAFPVPWKQPSMNTCPPAPKNVSGTAWKSSRSLPPVERRCGKLLGAAARVSERQPLHLGLVSLDARVHEPSTASTSPRLNASYPLRMTSTFSADIATTSFLPLSLTGFA